MSTLVFACPNTGRAIQSGIEIEPDTYAVIRKVRPRVHCIHCGQEHEPAVKEARLSEAA